jgi:hypothetical protein
MGIGIDSQDEFYIYIRQLPPKEDCRYLVRVGIALCNNENFKCPYKGLDTYTISSGTKRECKREETLRIKKLF